MNSRKKVILHEGYAYSAETTSFQMADAWVAAFQAEIPENMDEIFDFQDEEEKKIFYLQLSVAIGNVYKATMGGAYPEYAFGEVINAEKEDKKFTRLAKFVENSISLDYCFVNKSELSESRDDFRKYRENIKPYINQNPLILGTALVQVDDKQKMLAGLMSIFALCYFFDDGDFKTDNILELEHDDRYESVKIDPEIACGFNFFKENGADISDTLENVFESALFHEFVDAVLSQDFGASIYYPEIVKGLLENDAALKDFYNTIRKILTYSAENFEQTLKSNIDESFGDKIINTVAAFKQRKQYFQNGMKKINQLGTEATTHYSTPIPLYSNASYISERQDPTTGLKRKIEEEAHLEAKTSLDQKANSSKKSDDPGVSDIATKVIKHQKH